MSVYEEYHHPFADLQPDARFRVEWNNSFRNPPPLPDGWRLSIRRWENAIGMAHILDALLIAVNKDVDLPENTFRYMAGICWKRQKAFNEGETK